MKKIIELVIRLKRICFMFLSLCILMGIGGVGSVNAKKPIVASDDEVPYVAQFPDSDKYNGKVILIFHGGFGSASIQFERSENSEFVADALETGYGVIAVNSTDRDLCVWDTTADAKDNVDIQRVITILDAFDDLIDRDTPVYLAGISNGADFALLLADLVKDINISAAALFIPQGKYIISGSYSVPSIFLLAQNDEIALSKRSIENFSILSDSDKGVATQFWTHPPTPLYPTRFEKINGIEEEDSVNIYSALQSLLDDDSYLTPSAFEDSNQNGANDWQDAISPEYDNYIVEIGGQLRVCAAKHRYYCDYTPEVLNFFDSPSAEPAENPTIKKFNPDFGPAGETVTITGKNLKNATKVYFGLNRSPYIRSVSDTEIQATVPFLWYKTKITVEAPGGTVISNDRFTMTR